MNNTIIAQETFFEELKYQDNKTYAFLLGNGINYFIGNNTLSWNDLLGDFISKNFDFFKYKPNDGDISNTEVVNLIELLVDRKKDGHDPISWIRQNLMQRLDETLNFDCTKRCSMLDTAWGHHHILTTNFDENIEKYINNYYNVKLQYHDVKPTTGSKEITSHEWYLWNRFCGEKDCPSYSHLFQHHHAIWHIHGKLNNKSSRTVLFSLIRYINAIKQVEKWGSASDSNWPGRNTWVNIFYNEPLIIAGLRLTNQEVFLRALLIERKRYWKKLVNEKKQDKEPQSYYLVRKHSDAEKETDGRMFLRALGFKIVEFENAEEMYDNQNWNIINTI